MSMKANQASSLFSSSLLYVSSSISSFATNSASRLASRFSGHWTRVLNTNAANVESFRIHILPVPQIYPSDNLECGDGDLMEHVERCAQTHKEIILSTFSTALWCPGCPRTFAKRLKKQICATAYAMSTELHNGIFGKYLFCD